MGLLYWHYSAMERRENMSYSTMAHALIGYMESHLENFDIREMSESFGFSEIYLRELFLKNVKMPIMQYYKRRRIIVSAFEVLHSDRKIVDIAFESGFSNHESYTRAFRRIFGMTPSRFRIERPLIGRKQLDTGVFGLERLSGKEKRSDVSAMTQDDNKTILYGIRKIEQGAYGSRTMFPICVKAVSDTPCSDKEIVKMASDIMEARNEDTYAKGINAYGAWKDMLLDERWFENGTGFDELFSKLLVQNDAMVCICDGRKWGAQYFEDLSEKYGETEKAICRKTAKHFRKVSSIADEMMSLIRDWSDMEKMLENFGNRSVREKIGKLIDAAKAEDTMAYEQIKLLLNNI